MSQLNTFAIITDNFPPCAGGGIAEWAYGIAENLSHFGHQVTVISRWKKNVSANSHAEKSFQLIRMYGRDWKTYRYLYVLRHLWSYLKKNPSATILATTWELGQPFVFLKNFFPNAKLIVIAHGREVTQLKRRRKLNGFRSTIAAAKLVVAVSRFTQQAILEKINNIETPVCFLPNGVDADRFRYQSDYDGILKKLKVSSSQKIILTLARVIERKGHDTVLKALPQILKQFPETVYIIAGPWKEPYYQKLQELIGTLNLQEQVRFTSFVDDDDLTRYYSMSSVYVMVSRTIGGDSEGFGITFLEANACNCPVIGSYAGGIPDAIESGVSGFLVQPDAPDELAEKICLLFQDDVLRKKIQAEARERVLNRFTWAKIAERLLFEIQGVVA